MDVAFIAKKFDARNILSKKFEIYSKIVFMDAGNFFDTWLNWSSVTKFDYRTTSSTFFTVSAPSCGRIL